MSRPDPLDPTHFDDIAVLCDAQPITEPPEPRPTLRDGDVECCACEERIAEDDAYGHGWRHVTQWDAEARWECADCLAQDVDPPQW